MQQSAFGHDTFPLDADNHRQLDLGQLRTAAVSLIVSFNFVRLLKNHHHFVEVKLMGFICLGVCLGVWNLETHPAVFSHVISRHWPGDLINTKTWSYRYRNPHYKVRMV